jgi:hypothetical protein
MSRAAAIVRLQRDDNDAGWRAILAAALSAAEDYDWPLCRALRRRNAISPRPGR